MFDLFFSKYKMEFHKWNLRGVTIAEWIMLSVLCVLCVCLIIFSIFHQCVWGFLICSAGVVADTIIMLCYERKKECKTIDLRIDNYNRNVIDRLVQILQEDQYCLYNLNALNWLIDNCEEHIQTEKEQTPWVISTLFPVFTLAYGVSLDRMSAEEILPITIGVIIMIVLLRIVYVIAISNIIEIYHNPNKWIYQCLKNELEYIKIQYLAKADNSNHLLIL